MPVRYSPAKTCCDAPKRKATNERIVDLRQAVAVEMVRFRESEVADVDADADTASTVEIDTKLDTVAVTSKLT
jgi:hypothetical protein